MSKIVFLVKLPGIILSIGVSVTLFNASQFPTPSTEESISNIRTSMDPNLNRSSTKERPGKITIITSGSS